MPNEPNESRIIIHLTWDTKVAQDNHLYLV